MNFLKTTEKITIHGRKRNFAVPPMMKVEISAAKRKMKLGTATGPDSISVELSEALKDYGIDKITTLLNEIYDTGQISPAISKSLFYSIAQETRDNTELTTQDDLSYESLSPTVLN